jgi:hypothetical protein
LHVFIIELIYIYISGWLSYSVILPKGSGWWRWWFSYRFSKSVCYPVKFLVGIHMQVAISNRLVPNHLSIW